MNGSAAHPHLLPKPDSTGTGLQATLVVIPETGVDAVHYEPLVRKAQSTLASFGVECFACVLKSSGSEGRTATSEEAVIRALSYVEQSLRSLMDAFGLNNMERDKVFLMGHGEGGHTAQLAAVAAHLHSSEPLFGGIFSVGVMIQPFFVEAGYPVPVETMVGVRDGSVRISHLAQHRQRVEADFADLSSRARWAPVTIVPGFSHFTCCNNMANPAMLPPDLPPTVAPGYACANMSMMLSCWLHIHMPGTQAPVAMGNIHTMFIRHLENAEMLYFGPYKVARERDRFGATCTRAQRLLLGLEKPPQATCLPPASPVAAAGASVGALNGAGAADRPRSCRKALRKAAEQRMELLRPRVFLSEASSTSCGRVSGHKDVEENGQSGAATRSRRFNSAASRCFCRDGKAVIWPQASATELRSEIFAASSPAAVHLRCKLVSRAAAAEALRECTAHHNGASETRNGTHQVPEGSGRAGGGDGEACGHGVVTGGQGARDEFQGARLNEAVLLRMLEQLPEEVRQAYSVAPRKLQFGADLHASSLQQWEASELVLEEAGQRIDDAVAQSQAGAVVLRAVCFETPVGDAEDSGTFCCTVLSETQAFEYILYESQRM